MAGFDRSLTLIQLVNTPPVAGPDTIQRWTISGAKVAAATLLANDSDADGDKLTFDSFSAESAAGGTLTLNDGWIYYLPPAGFTNSDSFTYTISDGRGARVVGTVVVAIDHDPIPSPNLTIRSLGDGSYRIRVEGITGIGCAIEYTENLGLPGWQPLVRSNANTAGVFEWLDTPPQGAPQRYYRSVYP